MYTIDKDKVIASDSWYNPDDKVRVYTSNFDPSILEEAVMKVNNKKYESKLACLSDKVFIQEIIDFLKEKTNAPSPLLIILAMRHIFDLSLKEAQNLHYYPSSNWLNEFKIEE